MPGLLCKGTRITTAADLTAHFRGYLRVMNTRLWSNLAGYLAPRITLNGKKLSQTTFTTLVTHGASFSAELIVADVAKRTLAARMEIELTTTAMNEWNGMSGTPTTRVVHEHVFYHFNENWLIDEVFSMYSYGEDVGNQNQAAPPPTQIRRPSNPHIAAMARSSSDSPATDEETRQAKYAAKCAINRVREARAREALLQQVPYSPPESINT